MAAGVAVGVDAAGHAPEGVIDGACDGVDAAGVEHRAGTQAAPVYAVALAQGAPDINRLHESGGVSKSVVAVAGEVAQCVGAAGQGAAAVVGVARDAVEGRIFDGIDGAR